MKLSEYHAIVKALESSAHSDDLPSIATKFTQPTNTIIAIQSQQIQKRLKRTAHLHKSARSQAEHVQWYKSVSAGPVDAIAKHATAIGISPVMLARCILEQTESSNVAQLLRDPDMIRDPVLRDQVRHCLEVDVECGPGSDLIKMAVGDEYEEVLQDQLTLMGIPFLSEVGLRDKGYDKTPDILLTTPIAVEGHVVNWIESKASFGDEQSHRQYLREQYWSYWNRFGPGLVVYWFGFVEEVAVVTREKGVIVMDHLPTTVQTLLS